MAKNDKALANKVKAFRLENEIVQSEAARRLGVSIATYVRVEHGLGCSDLTRAKIEKRLLTPETAAA